MNLLDFRNLVSVFTSNRKCLVIKFDESAYKFLFVVLAASKKDISVEFFWERKLQEQENPKGVLPSLIEIITKKAGGGFSRIIWLVPEQYVILRRLALPRISDKDLSSAVVWNVKRVLPCKLEDLHFAYKVLDRGKNVDLLFYGILKDYISDFVPESVLSKVVLWPQDLAVREILLKVHPDIEKQNIFCAIYEEDSHTVVILGDKRANLLFKKISNNISVSSELMLIIEYYKKSSHDVSGEIPIYSLKKLPQEDVIYISTEELLRSLGGEGVTLPVSFLLACGAYLGFYFRKFPGIVIKEGGLKQEVKKEQKITPQMGVEQIFLLFEKVPTTPLVVVCFAVMLFFGLLYLLPLRKYRALQREYRGVTATLPTDVFPDPGSVSLQEIEVKRKNFEKEISVLNSYISNRHGMSKVLEVLKERFSHGFWLKLPFSITLDISTGKVGLTLTGGVYLGDEEEEMNALDELIKSLRRDLKGFFEDIELVYFRREKVEGREYLAFSLRCV